MDGLGCLGRRPGPGAAAPQQGQGPAPQGAAPGYPCPYPGYAPPGYGPAYGYGYPSAAPHFPHPPHHGHPYAGWAPPPGYAPGWGPNGPTPGWGPNGPQGAAGPLGPLGGWFDFRNEAFVRGALVGAAAAVLLTNPSIQKKTLQSLVSLWGLFQGGIEEMKERLRDAEAEMQAAAATAPEDEAPAKQD